ncbi:right-handed parallel beta-helix repeat-containing protein [Streptomyces litchfieldiae]|uniref:Right-handed parallel beta-helix repeat-containing protein n=1 Tax=Streptomyces litchfieldiae TaxID=3075543 RepID=A0ABU2MPU3_9ACTN|nr:carbohydrate-binding protein [Streptomyces sp. DSM 44938]MDT0343570.1 right-handed parallel beta-helix repeat-containing protein [Streptomyces sp. DSM 44938]
MKLKPLIACAALLACAAAVLPAASAAAATTRYEAEAAPATCAGTIDSNYAGYSGSGFCNGTNAVNAAAQFTANAATAGTATVSVRFANGTTTARPVDVVVNGSAVQSMSFEGTGSWATWTTKTFTVQVNSGSNTIRFSPTGSGGLPNVDYLDLAQDGGPLATALYVATNGNDSSAGTLAEPLLTIQRAVDLAEPGTTIYLRGGTYAPSTNIQLLKSGTASQPIAISNYNGERAVVDGENMPHTPAPVDGSIPRPERGAIHIEGEYWRITGLEIINGPYGIFGLDTSHNVFDRLVTRDNYESGLHLQGASSNNQILNLDSYNNRDPRKNGESADGLAIKEGSGTGNVVRGARLWNNSDDGFDAWEFLSPVTIENSLAWGNGYNRWNLPDYTGDGNGFKMGGGDEDLPAAHVTRNSMAWDNSAGGFIDNANPGALVADHCTAWRNGGTGFDYADADGTLTRNLAVSNGTNVSLGSNSGGSGNSWDLGGSWSFTSTDQSTITGPRQANGSIPSSTFLRPANGADVGARF